MGGNALSSSGATRCSRDVALQVLEDFLARFAQINGSLGNALRVEPIAAYREKPDFGDLDVLVGGLVERGIHDLCGLDRTLPVGHLFRSLIDEEDDDVCVRARADDPVGDLL